MLLPPSLSPGYSLFHSTEEREAREILAEQDGFPLSFIWPWFLFCLCSHVGKREPSTTSAPSTSIIINEQASHGGGRWQRRLWQSSASLLSPRRVSFRFLATDAGLASSCPLPLPCSLILPSLLSLSLYFPLSFPFRPSHIAYTRNRFRSNVTKKGREEEKKKRRRRPQDDAECVPTTPRDSILTSCSAAGSGSAK